MLLRTLGGLELEGSEFSRPKPLLLATYLALEGPRQRRYLADLIWPGVKDRRKSLGVALSQLRCGVPGLLQEEDTGSPSVRVETDVAAFRHALAEKRLEPALSHYRGSFLEGVEVCGLGLELEEWIYSTRERLAAAARNALLDLSEKMACREDWREVTRRAESALTLNGVPPLEPEEACRLHRLLLAAESPHQPRVREEAEELGAADLDETTQEARQVLRQLDSDALPEPPTNLDAATDSFVAREEEMVELGALIVEPATRLVSLLGPPGVGKTRLATEVARRAQANRLFQGGVFAVPLAPLVDPHLVCTRIAESLGFATLRGDVLAELQERLKRRQTLLVLDNFEHLLEAASDVAQLLSACPDLTILATSRVSLRLSGEREFPLQPLAIVPQEQDGSPDVETLSGAALELLRERAEAVRPDLEWSAENLHAARAICRRLDGLPLAIELAAARVRVFSLPELAARLERRLDALGDGARDRPQRHRTLRQAIGWSHELLDRSERRFFRRLAVFQGGCALPEIESLSRRLGEDAERVVERLDSLLAHSILQRVPSPESPPRFQMLETIREFGLERLQEAGEEQRLRRAHAEVQLRLAEQAAPELTGPEPVEWLARVRREQDNLRSALDWAVESGEIQLGLRLATASWRIWVAHGPMEEGETRLRRLLETANGDEDPQLRAAALNTLATLRHETQGFAEARPLLEESLALYRSLECTESTITVLNNLAWVELNLGKTRRAARLSREAFALAATEGDERGQALALNNLGWAEQVYGDLGQAREWHQRSLEHRRSAGDLRGEAFALTNIAWATASAGDGENALEWTRQALQILNRLQDDQLLAWAHTMRGFAHTQSGDLSVALVDLDEGASLFQKVGNAAGETWALLYRGQVRAQSEEAEAAESDLRHAIELARGTGQIWLEARTLRALGQLLGDPDLEHEAEAILRQADVDARSSGPRSLGSTSDTGAKVSE